MCLLLFFRQARLSVLHVSATALSFPYRYAFDLEFAVKGFEQNHSPFSTRDIPFKYAIEVRERPFLDEDSVSAFELLGNRSHDIAFHSFLYRGNDLLRYHLWVLLADDEFDPPGVLDHVPVSF